MQISDNPLKNEVVINGKTIPGFLSYETCPTCQTRKVYHRKYDAFFCPGCNQWLEANCGDETCHYCLDRPETPL